MSESGEKTNLKTIGTHDGRFHCDEALACFMLRQLEEYKNAEIVRSRNEEILAKCDIVVDVGGIFDVTRNALIIIRSPLEIPSAHYDLNLGPNMMLSSAGLIYVHYGEEIISAILQKEVNVQLDKKSLEMIFRMVYEKFIQEIDAIDNGVPMFEGEAKYSIHTGINSRIQDLNQQWKIVKEPFDSNEQFGKAMNLVGSEFVQKILHYTESWLPARTIVEQALLNREKIHPSGSIMLLEPFCPWKEHLAQLEVEHKIEGCLKYVVWCDGKSDYRCMAVPVTPESVICRKFLHKDWRGLRGEELEKVSGIPQINFVHHNGFIGGAFSREA
uniref:Uncharacterized protein n=1 Tax=Lutzomyia longipalpis TaxID=7200 RepID=A0A1B0GIV2_LUTLO